MSTHPQRKVAIGILVLALTALALDRTVLKMSPLGAQSASAAATPGGSSTQESPAKSAAKPAPAQAMVAFHLQTVALTTGLVDNEPADVFNPIAVFGPGPGRDGAQSPAAEEFSQKHRLASVLISGLDSRAQATIDDQPLRIGDRVKGSQLLSITELSATFDVEGEKVVLIMALPTKEEFAQHKLNSVLLTKDARGAVVVIDGKRQVQVFDRLDGYRLMAVDTGSATFEAEHRRVVLEVPRAK